MINLFVVNVKSRHIFDIPSDLSLSVFADGSGYNVFYSCESFFEDVSYIPFIWLCSFLFS